MTIHETRTPLAPEEVIERARTFFTHSGTPYAAFTEKVGSGFLKLRMDEGEIVIAALPGDGSTLVRGSASRGGHLLTRFLTLLAYPLEAKQTINRYGLYRTGAAQVKAQANGQGSPRQLAARQPAQAA